MKKKKKAGKKKAKKSTEKSVRRPFGSTSTGSKPSVSTPTTATVRIPPNDPTNEGIVIVAVLTSEKYRKKYLQTLSADYFYAPKHIEIWQGLQMMFRKVDDYTPAALKQFGAEIDTDYLEQLVEQLSDQTHNVKLHIDTMKFDRARIEMATGPLTRFMELLKDPKTSRGDLRGAATAIPDALAGFGTAAYVRDNAALLAEIDADLTARREGKAIYPYGLPGLDRYGAHDTRDGKSIEGEFRIVPGLFPGGITTVSGVSGSGKSTTTMCAMLNVVESGRSVLFGALEQGSKMTLQLMAAMSLGMSRTDLMIGNYEPKDKRELLEKAEQLQQNVRFFTLPFGKARGERDMNDRNMDIIEQTCADFAPDVFVLDLFRRTLKETRPDDEEQALYRMQSMAQERKCHFILVQQQKEKAIKETRVKFPTRENIMGSSAGWVGVSDNILLWYRPAMYKNEEDDRVWCLVDKQRDGVGKLAVELEWDPEYGYVGEGRAIPFPKEMDEGDDDAFSIKK